LLCVGALAGAATVLAAQSGTPGPISAYADGKTFIFKPVSGHGHVLKVGDTVLGHALADRKPQDSRPNLYVFAPGTQYDFQHPDAIQFSLVVSELPRSAEPVLWDVYWALLLDPGLHTETITSERKLLLATQETFLPNQPLRFDYVPAAPLLRAQLHIDSVEGLNRFRRPGGGLPRIVIIPANFVVRASVVDPDAPTTCPPPEGAISRAISVLSRRCRKPAEAEKPAAKTSSQNPGSPNPAAGKDPASSGSR